MRADFAGQIAAGRVWVAVTGGALAGYVVCYADGPGWHVENLAVAPESQRHGVGARLLAHAETLAAAAGATRVALYTNQAMETARAFYPRQGYRETGRRVEEGYRRVYFEKTLAGPGGCA